MNELQVIEVSSVPVMKMNESNSTVKESSQLDLLCAVCAVL